MEINIETINKVVELLINEFPESEEVKKSDISEAVKFIFNGGVNYYQEVSDVLYEALHKVFPYLAYSEWEEKLKNGLVEGNYEDYTDKYYNYTVDRFHFWAERVKFEFHSLKGNRRTYEKACSLAADKWCEMIFGNRNQDNGDRSGYSDMMMLLGSMLKSDAQKDISLEVIENARKGFEKFYHNGCIWKFDDGKEWKIDLYCDYSPNLPLYEILCEAGVPMNDIRSICPWKTGVEIDKLDNAVVVRHYNERKYY